MHDVLRLCCVSSTHNLRTNSFKSHARACDTGSDVQGLCGALKLRRQASVATAHPEAQVPSRTSLGWTALEQLALRGPVPGVQSVRASTTRSGRHQKIVGPSRQGEARSVSMPVFSIPVSYPRRKHLLILATLDRPDLDRALAPTLGSKVPTNYRDGKASGTRKWSSRPFGPCIYRAPSEAALKIL